MGQGSSVQKCGGCEKTTPFFGEIYGRMSEGAHGATGSGFGHRKVGIIVDGNSKTEYREFNQFKNKLLIPFYGTVLAVRVLAAGLMKKVSKWNGLGLSTRLAINLSGNDKLKHWFAARIIIALIPVVGTLVNGALDIIAQVGLQYKTRGHASVQ